MFKLYMKCECGQMLFSDGTVFTNLENFEMKGVNHCPACSRDLSQYHKEANDLKSNATFYIGDRKNGKKHGYGSYTNDEGIYIGEWKDDKKHGYGIMKWVNGVLYAGEWHSNEIHGKGVTIVPDAEIFMGEFKNSECTGNGIEKFADGKVLIGKWRKNRRNDRCTLFNPDGSIEHDGYYKEDNLLNKDGKQDN